MKSKVKVSVEVYAPWRRGTRKHGRQDCNARLHNAGAEGDLVAGLLLSDCCIDSLRYWRALEWQDDVSEENHLRHDIEVIFDTAVGFVIGFWRYHRADPPSSSLFHSRLSRAIPRPLNIQQQ